MSMLQSKKSAKWGDCRTIYYGFVWPCTTLQLWRDEVWNNQGSTVCWNSWLFIVRKTIARPFSHTRNCKNDYSPARSSAWTAEVLKGNDKSTLMWCNTDNWAIVIFKDWDEIALKNPTLIQAKDVPRTHVTVIKIPVVETSVGGVEAINIPELNALQKINCATIAR